jgi:transcription initiation factor TFIIB
VVIEIEVSYNKCPECAGSVLNVPERGETVCEVCGLVVDERGLDRNHSGIRAYSKQEKDKKERNGSPISILTPDIGFSTIIERKEIKNPDLKRAAKWNSQMSWEKRNLLIALTELKRLGVILNFPDRVKKAAILLYKQVFRKKLLRGRSINGMVAACAYYVSKQENIPITFQELIDESSMEATMVKKCYKILMRDLGLKSQTTDPIALIPRYRVELGMDIETENKIINLLEKYLKKNSVCGKDPKGLCAGALYLVSKFKNLKVNQKHIADVVGITEVTLRSRYKELITGLSLMS